MDPDFDGFWRKTTHILQLLVGWFYLPLYSKLPIVSPHKEP